MKRNNINEIFKELEGMINFYLIKFPDWDKDNIKQEVMIRVWKASRKFNSKYSVKTYFQKVIQNEIKRLIFINNKYLRHYKPVSLDSNFGLDNKSYCLVDTIKDDKNDIDNIIERDNIYQLYYRVYDKLEGKDKKIFKYFLEGFRFREIAKKLKTSISMVQHIRCNIIFPLIRDELNNYKYCYL